MERQVSGRVRANLTSSGPCERCLRETRECVRAKPTFVRDAPPRKTDSRLIAAQRTTPASGSAPAGRSPSPQQTLNSRYSDRPPPTRYAQHLQGLRTKQGNDSSDEDEEDTLVNSNLQNPGDALKLLASASSLQYRALGQQSSQNKAKTPDAPGLGHVTETWCEWIPIKKGYLSVHDAQILFSRCAVAEIKGRH